MKTLVDGQTCFVTRADGRLTAVDGLYHRDTRYLSALDVDVPETELDFVGGDDRSAGRRTLLYQPRDCHGDVTQVPDGTRRRQGDVVFARTQVVREGRFHERLTLSNHSNQPLSDACTVSFDVDFADIFEVRGLDTDIDRSVAVDIADRTVTFRYDYPDAEGGERNLVSTVSFWEVPDTLTAGRATFTPTLGPQETTTYTFSVHAGTGGANGIDPFEQVTDPRGASATDPEPTAITTGDVGFDQTFTRSVEDLQALTTETPHGTVPVTGVPWFATVFGRDAVLSAYQALPVAPSLATGTLRYLAAHQGTTDDEYRDERPGKILHEIRHGELARRELIPHTPYFGTVDATPLWVVLLAETYRWLDDESLVEELWENLESALDWITTTVEGFGDDPFLYYHDGDVDGLPHKAWRDTEGSVQFADGEYAEAPLASVEVQGYVYDALRRAASLYRDVRDDQSRADDLERRADRLQDRFDATFWLPEREFYGAALTDDGRVVDSATSNVGQCLWTGIVPEQRADAVADRLLAPDLFSGWGIRTMSTTDTGYGPLSYHVGSVWPHDTSLIALGLARYGYHDAVDKVASGLLSAATQFEHNRLPELFGGFDDSLPPMVYDASCSPQAWAATAPFALLRAMFDAGPGPNGMAVGREPTVVAPEAIDPLVETWAADDPASLWHFGEQA